MKKIHDTAINYIDCNKQLSVNPLTGLLIIESSDWILDPNRRFISNPPISRPITKWTCQWAKVFMCHIRNLIHHRAFTTQSGEHWHIYKLIWQIRSEYVLGADRIPTGDRIAFIWPTIRRSPPISYRIWRCFEMMSASDIFPNHQPFMTCSPIFSLKMNKKLGTCQVTLRGHIYPKNICIYMFIYTTWLYR